MGFNEKNRAIYAAASALRDARNEMGRTETDRFLDTVTPDAVMSLLADMTDLHAAIESACTAWKEATATGTMRNKARLERAMIALQAAREGHRCSDCGGFVRLTEEGVAETHSYPPGCRAVCHGTNLPPRDAGSAR